MLYFKTSQGECNQVQLWSEFKWQLAFNSGRYLLCSFNGCKSLLEFCNGHTFTGETDLAANHATQFLYMANHAMYFDYVQMFFPRQTSASIPVKQACMFFYLQLNLYLISICGIESHIHKMELYQITGTITWALCGANTMKISYHDYHDQIFRIAKTKLSVLDYCTNLLTCFKRQATGLLKHTQVCVLCVIIILLFHCYYYIENHKKSALGPCLHKYI